MKLEIWAPPRVVVAGQSGTGKTTLCRWIVDGLGDRVVVWDPMGQYPAAVSYVPRDFTDPAEAEALVRRAFYAPGPYTVLFEEVEQVFPNEALPPMTRRYVLMGRNYGKGWVVNVRRPQNASKQFLDEHKDLFLHRLDGRALDYMVAYLGKEEGPRLEEMRSWHETDHRFFHRRGGVLTLTQLDL